MKPLNIIIVSILVVFIISVLVIIENKKTELATTTKDLVTINEYIQEKTVKELIISSEKKGVLNFNEYKKLIALYNLKVQSDKLYKGEFRLFDITNEITVFDRLNQSLAE